VSKLLPTAALVQAADLSAAPPRTRIERNFGLPTRLYAITAACYFAFLGILSLALMEPQLVIPMVICVIIVAAYFIVPRKWATMRPDNAPPPLSWSKFKQHGIATHTGPVAASDAVAQVLILPVLILLWGCAVVTIRALT
jgi:hypothetical protein